MKAVSFQGAFFFSIVFLLSWRMFSCDSGSAVGVQGAGQHEHQHFFASSCFGGRSPLDRKKSSIREFGSRFVLLTFKDGEACDRFMPIGAPSMNPHVVFNRS